MEASEPMADTGVEDTRIPVRDIPVEEPPLPRRTRRPQDIFRLVLTAIGVIAAVGLAIVAERTLDGLTQDLRDLGRLPRPDRSSCCRSPPSWSGWSCPRWSSCCS